MTKDWPVVSLGDVCSHPEYGLTTSAVKLPVGPKLLRITDIISGTIDWGSVPYCEATEGEASKYALNDGDIVIARTGATVGYSAYVASPPYALFASYLIRFIAGPTADSRFLSHILQSTAWFNHVDAVASGKSAQPNMNAQDMARFQFELPSLPVQKAIAGTLGALDDKIESNRRAIELANALLDSSVELYAAELPITPLGSMTSAAKRSINPTIFGETLVDHFSLPAFDEHVWPERTPATSIMSNKIAIEQPSILISRLNPRFNRTWWVVPEEGIPAIASTEFSCLTAASSEDLAALWLAVRDPYFKQELIRRVTGTSGSHQRIRPDDMLAIDVPDVRQLSTEAKQQALALLELIHVRRQESRALSSLKRTLLPELLSGRRQVSEPAAIVGEVVA